MTKISFTGDWQKQMAELGLRSFDDFFSYDGGLKVNRNEKRDVSRIVFDNEQGRRAFFRKRFYSPHLKDMFFALKSSGCLCSQAELEWNNIQLLLKNGIQTYKPVCFGVKTVCGFEQRSFLVTEEINGRCLADFVRDNWPKLSSEERRDLISSLGIFIRRIHNAGICLPDLYIWHIFILENSRYDFAVIDLHRMKKKAIGSCVFLKDMGRLDHSMADTYFGDDDRRLLVRSYAGDDRFFDTIRKYSAAVSRKRRLKKY